MIFSEGFRKSRTLTHLKRAMDVVIAAVGLLLILPLMLIIAAVVRLTSAGVAPKVSMNRGNRFWGTNSDMPFVKKYTSTQTAAMPSCVLGPATSYRSSPSALISWIESKPRPFSLGSMTWRSPTTTITRSSGRR